MEIRSYRKVFELERRIYRVERLRLNPTGVPVRGVGYFLVLLFATLLVARLPLFGVLMRVMPWYLRDLAGPGIGAALLTIVKLEGRPFHLAAFALLRYGIAPRELAGMRPYRANERLWRPDELLVLPDGSDSRLRRLRYSGPGTVRVSVAHTRAEWPTGLSDVLPLRANLTLTALPRRRAPKRSQVIELAAGARLEVRP
jgi:hypothetical protein